MAIRKREQEVLLSGVLVARNAPKVCHLLFADDFVLFGRATIGDCEVFRAILDDYAKASGHIVNFSKSLITFSPNVDVALQEEIRGRLGLSGQVQNHDQYLGPPSFIGKSKRSNFNGIKKRVSKNLQMWKRKIFSVGAREVLIKAVAQATATYTMSVFKLPSSLCHELQVMVARFWWGGAEDSRKIH